MKANWFKIVLVVSLALLLAACNEIASPAYPVDTSSSPLAAQTQKGSSTTSLTQEPGKDGTQMTPTTLPPSTSGLDGLIEKAKEDLAQRLSIEITQISLIEAKVVVWPDSSLGCPQPGMRYKQVPEDGALIVLQAHETTYEYHNGGSRGLFLCDKMISIPEKSPQIDITNLTPQVLDKNTPPPKTPSEGVPPGENQ